MAVTKDPALAEALERAARLVDGDVKAATLVHDLAIKGAESLVLEEAERRRRIEDLIRIFVTREEDVLDWDVLARVEEEAWCIEPEQDPE